MNRKKSKSMFGRFIQYYKPHKKLLIIDLGCAIIISCLDLIFPLISRLFINDFIPNERVQSIINFSVLLLVLYIIRMILQFIVDYWGHVMGTRIEADMRFTFFNHLQTLPFDYYDNTKTGQIMARLIGDLRDIGELSHHGPEDFLLSVFMILGSFIALVFLNWRLTLIVFFFVAILIWFALSRRIHLIKKFREVRKSHGKINERLESSISGIRLCKSFTNEKYEINQFKIRNSDYRESYRDAYKDLAIYSSGTNFLTELLSIVVISIGGYYVYRGWLSISFHNLRQHPNALLIFTIFHKELIVTDIIVFYLFKFMCEIHPHPKGWGFLSQSW